jgi:hypothetical protein
MISLRVPQMIAHQQLLLILCGHHRYGRFGWCTHRNIIIRTGFARMAGHNCHTIVCAYVMLADHPERSGRGLACIAYTSASFRRGEPSIQAVVRNRRLN